MADFATLALETDTSGLTDGQSEMRRLATVGDQTERSVTTSNNRMSAAWRQMAVRAAGALGAIAGGLVSIHGIAGAARDMDDLAKAARRLDMSVGGFQALRLVADEAGTSVGSLANDVQTMAREIERGSDRAARAAGNLGVSLSDLRQMDTETRLEVIADRIHEMGLNAGQASTILQDFGIRNREMVLMMMQGGDAMRQARNDIRDYGLELSATTTGAMEQANDRLGRLGLVFRGFGQAIASAVVPALGALAHAITESMREGGTLRTVMENVRGVAIAAGVAITAYYTPAILAATWQTGLWIASLITLRGALLATGIGALVVAAGMMVNWFIRLIENTGGWGAALVLLGEVASGVWEGIKTSAGAMLPALQAVFFRIREAWFNMLADMAARFTGFVSALSGLSAVPGMASLAIPLAAATKNLEGFREAATGAGVAASVLEATARQKVATGFDAASAAVDRLMDAVNGLGDFAPDEIDNVRSAVDGMNEALSQTGDGAGGGAAGGAAASVDDLTSRMGRLGDASREIKSSFESAFVSVVTDIGNARQAVSRLAADLARMAAQAAFRQLFGGFFGGGSFGGGRAMGGPVSRGTTYLVGERGPELFTPAASGAITPNHELSGGGGKSVTIHIDARGSVEGEAERFARYFGGEGKRIVQNAVAAVTDRRARGYA